MYIGPWQEYKLARLIQEHHQDRAGRRPNSRPNSSRRHDDDTASLSSSKSFSGLSRFSSNSAPAESRESAQSRLNELCDTPTRRYGSTATGAPRPRTGLPPRAAPPRGTRSKAGAKAKAKPKAQQSSMDEVRRARILQMQRLYGLCKDEDEQPQNSAEALLISSSSSACVSPGPSGAAGPGRSSPPTTFGDRRNANSCQIMPEADNALRELRGAIRGTAEFNATSLTPSPSLSPPPHQMSSGYVAVVDGAGVLDGGTGMMLPAVPEDPFNQSLSMDSSAGLIAWSKNLCPEELSPPATLANFLRPS